MPTDNIRVFVLKLLGIKLRGVLQQLDVSSAAFETVLKLDFVLYHEGLVGVVDGFRKLHGNSVVSSSSLRNETQVAFKALENRGLLDGPLAAVSEKFVVGDA